VTDTPLDARNTPVEAAARLTAATSELLETIARSERTSIRAAAEALFDTVRSDGLIHVAAAGHGLILVLESFYRAGGLACVNPIWDPALLPLSGAGGSTVRERTPGLGTDLADRAGIASGDSLVVFSQSGATLVPIELAERGHALGATLIAVTSRAHGAAVASRHPAGLRLVDVADIVIDNHVPAGDAAFELWAGAPLTAAMSTLAGVHVWNLLLVDLIERAQAAGADLPIWISSSISGGDARIAELMATYHPRIRAL
jgi:uncharacterized phosphosugar-binding protein